MSIGFYIVGFIIFSVYIFFTMWNIFHSNKQQAEENYPNLNKKRDSNYLEVENDPGNEGM
jgi:hypothetical protein